MCPAWDSSKAIEEAWKPTTRPPSGIWDVFNVARRRRRRRPARSRLERGFNIARDISRTRRRCLRVLWFYGIYGCYVIGYAAVAG